MQEAKSLEDPAGAPASVVARHAAARRAGVGAGGSAAIAPPAAVLPVFAADGDDGRAAAAVDPAVAAAIGSGGSSVGEDTIQRALSTLKAKTDDLKSEVVTTVKGHWGVVSTSFVCVSDLLAKVKDLQDELRDVMNSLQPQDRAAGPRGSAVQSALRQQQLNKQIAQCQAVLQVLQSLSQAHEQLLSFDRDLDGGKYQTAAETLVALENLQTKFQDTDDPDANVYKAVRAQTMRKRTKLRSRLLQLFGQAVKVEARQIRVVTLLPGPYGHTHYDNRVDVIHILDAMNHVGALDECLTGFVREVLQRVMAPILRNEVYPEIRDDNESEVFLTSIPNPPAEVEFPADADVDIEGMPQVQFPSELFGHLNTVLTFIETHIFRRNADMMRRFGSMMWQAGTGSKAGFEGLAPQLEAMLRAAVPESSAAMTQFLPILEAADAFEKNLYAKGYLKDEVPVLRSFSTESESHFAYKKRLRVLADARRVLTAEYHNSQRVWDSGEIGTLCPPERVAGRPTSGKGARGVDETDDALFFRLPLCEVSKGAVLLVQLAHSAMAEACKSSKARCANVLYHTARDALDMFRAIVPARFADSIASVPRLAMLLHNDCLYIAHHCMTMGHLYRQSLPPPMNRTATMVDMVPAFRALAEQTFVREIQRQQAQLREFMQEAPSFTQLHDDTSAGEVEAAVKRQRYHLTQLSGSWGDVLPAHIYFRAMGYLLDTTLKIFLDRVGAMKEIPLSSTHQLKAYLSLLFECEKVFGASELYTAPMGPEIPTSGSPTSVTPRSRPPVKANQFCALWDRAQELASTLAHADGPISPAGFGTRR